MKNNLVVSNLLIQDCSPLGLQIRASGIVVHSDCKSERAGNQFLMESKMKILGKSLEKYIRLRQSLSRTGSGYYLN